jgi:carbamoyltransferase
MSRQLFEYDPKLAFKFIPNLKARVAHEGGGYLIQTNSSGFRCRHDFAAVRNPKRPRLLLFGNSFTAGEGVSDGQRFGDRLEELLEVDVFNFGLPGTGTDQHYLAFKEYGSTIAADLTIIAVCVENIRRTAARYRQFKDGEGRIFCYGKPYFTLVNGDLQLGGVPAMRDPIPENDLPPNERGAVDRGGRFATLRKIVNQAGLRELAQLATRYQPLPHYQNAQNPDWLVLRAILEHFITDAPKPVVVLPIPLYQHVEETVDASSYQARFRELAEGSECCLHDPLPDLLKYPARDRRKFRFDQDVHPTPAGHAALAASLAPVIAKLLGLSKKL